MKKLLGFMMLIILIVFALVACKGSEKADEPKKSEKTDDIEKSEKTDEIEKLDTNTLSSFKGKWECEFETKELGTYDMVLDIYVNDDLEKVLLSTDKYKTYYLPVDWEIKDNSLILTLNVNEDIAIVTLSLLDEDTMEGTYRQYGNINDITFAKTSDDAVNGSFHSEASDKEYENRIQQLKDYSEYADDNTTIPFTYELNLRDKYQELIDTYDLDTVTKGYYDVDLMLRLCNWVCDIIPNIDGSAGMPADRNAYAIIDYYNNFHSIDARGRAILLAELLRLYGIPAKHITCLRQEADNNCTIVVHAYSEKYGQWIMLDSTCGVIFKNKNGDFVNLKMLREILMNGEELIPHEDSALDVTQLDMDSYRWFMTMNTFRFTCATDFGYGAEEGFDGNIANMLVPVNYDGDKNERTTTSDQAFWALP